MAWHSLGTVYRGARLALVLGVVLCLAEARAYAGCNDHTVFSFRSIASSSSPTDPVSSNQQSADVSDLRRALPCSRCPTSPAAPVNAPCRGPFCSGNKAPVGLPITAPNPKVQEQLTALALPAGDEQDEHSDWLSPDQFVTPITSADPIFHPPR
jgi:hypothetical protein